MSQAFDLVSAHPIQGEPSWTSNQNLSLRIVLFMFAVGVALSLISLALPDWVFQPSNATTFPLT
jgi:hypothetical protein